MRAGYNQAMILGIIDQQDQLNIRVLTNYRRYLSMLNNSIQSNLLSVGISLG
jgi:hypothetical protein